MFTWTTQNVNKQRQTAWRQTGCGTFFSPGWSNSNTRGDEFDLVTPKTPLKTREIPRNTGV